jgi:hypothetical protein
MIRYLDIVDLADFFALASPARALAPMSNPIMLPATRSGTMWRLIFNPPGWDRTSRTKPPLG